MLFKIGDRVKCIDNRGSSQSKELTIGKVYTVKRVDVDSTIIVLNDLNHNVWYRDTRFEKAEVDEIMIGNQEEA